jgi:hypothetical protein
MAGASRCAIIGRTAVGAIGEEGIVTLPAGFVTFLFTDIESSSRRWEDLTVRHGTLEETLRTCRESLIITVDHHKAVVAMAILAPTAVALDQAGETDAATTLLGCLTAHGQRPPAPVEADAFADRHPVQFDRGSRLTLPQAVDVAVSCIDAVLSRGTALPGR